MLRADISAVQHQLDLLDFPPVSPNGALLMNAIAKRQRLPVPKVPVTYHQTGTRWDAAFAIQIAPLFDDLAADAKVLAKRFAPDIGKEWHFNPDQPRDDHGRWSGPSSDGGGGGDDSDDGDGDGDDGDDSGDDDTDIMGDGISDDFGSDDGDDGISGNTDDDTLWDNIPVSNSAMPSTPRASQPALMPPPGVNTFRHHPSLD